MNIEVSQERHIYYKCQALLWRKCSLPTWNNWSKGDPFLCPTDEKYYVFSLADNATYVPVSHKNICLKIGKKMQVNYVLKLTCFVAF